MVRKSFFLCLLFGGFTLAEEAFCMNSFESIQATARRDLSTMFVVSPTELKVVTEQTTGVLKAMEGENSDEEEILDYIAPVCAKYRERAAVVAFDELAGVDPNHMLECQVATSNYYRTCADAMSELIGVLLKKSAGK